MSRRPPLRMPALGLPALTRPAAAADDGAALATCVNADGKRTHMQPVGFTPVTFDADHSEPFGVGAFLLAGSEVSKLQPSSQPQRFLKETTSNTRTFSMGWEGFYTPTA